MKNSSYYKSFSEYKKQINNISLNNIGIPSLYDRIVVIETINTGPNPKVNNIIEISCMEMMGGKITGYEFDAFLHPRYSINEVTKQKTNLNNNFYDEFYKDVYLSDKSVLEQLKKFVKQSKIISFNATKEMEFINNELIHQKINAFPKNKFYSVQSIFNQMFPKAIILSLNKCCDFLEIKLPKEKYHTSKNDCFAVAKIISKLYDIINDNKNTKQNPKENNDKENNRLDENSQNNSSSCVQSNRSGRNSDIDYSEILNGENINDENRSENIINSNEKSKKEKDNKSDIKSISNISDKSADNKKYLNKKRNFEDLDNLKNNLKTKEEHKKDENVKENEIELDENKYKKKRK